MNFINPNNAIKDFAKFIIDIFLKDDTLMTSLKEKKENDNILHQLIVECLPELSDVTSKSSPIQYSNLIPGINDLFKENESSLFYEASKQMDISQSSISSDNISEIKVVISLLFNPNIVE